MIKRLAFKMINGLNFNSSRIHLEHFLTKASEALPKGGLILDAGAGDQRYRKYFTHGRYESSDICMLERDYGDITYVCDLTSIPVEDNKYDMIICTQVLEHVPEPEKVLMELNRVIKPNGELWLTAPLFYQEHEKPYDFFRYTQFGFKYLMDKTNFNIEKIDWLEGYYMTLAYKLRMASSSLSLNFKNYGLGLIGVILIPFFLFLKIQFQLLSYFFAKLDTHIKITTTGMCKNYALVAKKK